MNPYPQYVNSKIQWIGSIPSHWTVKKIKHLCYVKGRVGWKGLKSSEFLDKGFAYLVTGTDFIKGRVNWEDCYHIDKERYEEDPYIQLENGDLLITKDGTIGKLAIVSNLDKPACLNSGIFVVRPLSNELSTRYLYWILGSEVFTIFNDYTSYGSTIQHLYQNVFIEFPFCVPPSKEQLKIADFLDRKTAAIDNLIAQKERLIELLQEERTAVISTAVTQGLNPNAPRKPSNIPWLGDIPAHWNVVPLTKYMDSIVDYRGKTPKKVESGQYLVTARNIKNGIIDYSLSEEYVDEEEASKLLNRGLPKIGDVLFTTEAPLGEVANVDREDIALAQRIIKFSGQEDFVDNYYLKLWMSSAPFQHDLQSYATGSTAIGIKASKLFNLKLLLPPLMEQQIIVEFVNQKTTQIAHTVAQTEKQITLLQEYRTTLISHAVTGKIDVRHA